MKKQQLKTLIKRIVQEALVPTVKEQEETKPQITFSYNNRMGTIVVNDAAHPNYGMELTLEDVQDLMKLISRIGVKNLASRKDFAQESMTTRTELDAGTMKAVNLQEMRQLSVPEKHQLKIALQTLRAPDAMAGVMGGMNKEEARAFLKTLGYSDVQITSIESMKEQSASGGAGGYQTPFAFKRRNTENHESDHSELETDTSLKSVCCGAHPLGQVDKSNSGTCSKCKEHTTFEKSVNEETGTGAVAGYQTPFAFSKNKSGSKRAVDVTRKMGYKVVGPSPRV